MLVGFQARNHGQQVEKRGALEKVDDRRTPRWLFDKLNDEFRFTLDAAASHENALCSTYFTTTEDGLTRQWRGSVWCNPPYSDCGAWVRKANYESRYVDSIVMLLPANRTEQKWWQETIEPNREHKVQTRFLPGRLRFDVPEGTYSDPRGNRPPFGCVVVIWTSSTQRALLAPKSTSGPSVEARRTEFNLGAGFDKQQGGDEQSSSSGGGS